MHCSIQRFVPGWIDRIVLFFCFFCYRCWYLCQKIVVIIVQHINIIKDTPNPRCPLFSCLDVSNVKPKYDDSCESMWLISCVCVCMRACVCVCACVRETEHFSDRVFKMLAYISVCSMCFYSSILSSSINYCIRCLFFSRKFECQIE